MRFRDKVSRAAVTFLSDWKNMYIIIKFCDIFWTEKKIFIFLYMLLLNVSLMNVLVYFDIIPGHSLGGKFSHFSFSNHILPKTSPIIMDIFFFKSEIS